MTDPVWDPSGAVDDALRSIAFEYGPSILSSPAELGPHLRDRLPDSPKQVALILGAAESEVAVSLREHLDQGMDRDGAAQLAAATLIERTPFDEAGCRWVAGEFADALEASGVGTHNDAHPATVSPGVADTQALAGAVTGAEVWAPPGDDPSKTPSEPVTDVGGGDSKPPRKRRALVLGAVLVLVLGGLTIGAAVASIGPFAPSAVPLAELMPDDVSSCTYNGISAQEKAFAHGFTGLTGLWGCAIIPIDGGIFAFQFDNSTDYAAGVKRYENFSGFDPQVHSDRCPPPQGFDGETLWFTNTYPKMAGQNLLCALETSGSPDYTYFLPTRNVFFTVIAGATTSFHALDNWFANHGGPGPHGPGHE